MKVTFIPIVIGALSTVTKGLIKRIRGLRNNRTSEDHQKYIIEIGQNTEKSPRDLRRLVVTQNSRKDHQLTLMRKTLKEKIIDSAVLLYYRVKIKENERWDKHLHLARGLKRRTDLKVMICYRYTRNDPQKLSKWAGWVRKRRTSIDYPNLALLKSVRIMRSILETWGDSLSLRLQGKTIS